MFIKTTCRNCGKPTVAHPAVTIPICFVCYYAHGAEVLNRILTGAISTPKVSIGGMTAEEYFGIPTAVSHSHQEGPKDD